MVGGRAGAAAAFGNVRSREFRRPGPGAFGRFRSQGSVLRKTTSSANWSWDGGTAITVAAGETIDTIARRYGVPASVIMQANNITAPATLYPGPRLVIPRYNQSRVATAPLL
jgi:membrane-bound lytic murein transglycosylase B